MTDLTDGKYSIDALAAIEEIKQLKAQYCYCVDNKDWPCWALLFTPPARVDEREAAVARDPVTKEPATVVGLSVEFLNPITAFEWPLVGREAIQNFGETIAANNHTVHRVFTPEIALTSRYTGKAIWPMEDYVSWPEGSAVRHQHGMGYYHETYERLDVQKWYFKTIDLALLV